MVTAELRMYLEEISGETPSFQAIPKNELTRVPLFLSVPYEFFRSSVLGRSLILAVVRGAKSSTPQRYADQFRQLQKLFDEQVVLVLPQVNAGDRQRLLRLGVPFIVPRRQMFIPMQIDLREHFPRGPQVHPAQLSGPACLLLLFHLQKSSVEEITFKSIAKLLGYSGMTITVAAGELQSHEICNIEITGREKKLRFAEKGAALWRIAEPLMPTPVLRYARLNGKVPMACRSGMSALSVYTDINDDAVPTYAIKKGEERSFEVELVSKRSLFDPGDIRIELWRYDPGKLAVNGVVDPLSLYLSLRDMTDERVQGELEKLWRGLT